MNSKGLRINNVEVDTEILNALLNQNKKIEAIKYIVEHCNIGLKEAKDFVDNYDSDNIELNADLNGVAVDPYGQTKAGFEITGEISRKEFDLTWSPVTEAGSIVVSDKVKLVIDAQFIKQA